MSSASSAKHDDENPHVEVAISEAERSAFDKAVEEAKLTPFAISATLETSGSISEDRLESCFDLIEQTSAAAYKASSRGWCPKQKWREMREEGMRYILVHDARTKEKTNNDGKVLGFISFMITEEDGYDVSYIYEIHLSDKLRGVGVGSSLMAVVHKVALALGMEMSMLTVFTSNNGAIRLYERLGYEKWDEELIISKRKKLRSGLKEIKPSYVILAKSLKEGKGTMAGRG